ncbi:MAG: restriction endonuclease subunit M [Oscillospiraceae bacterium]|nr:restriction endonuclease subunit M [Oscillospiraceae bacterium]
MEKNLIDIKENFIYRLDNELLDILLKDRSSGKNIIWATDNYSARGYGYQWYDNITVPSVTGHNGNVVKPRVEKSKKEQTERIKQKAEVFTPSWICNKQNNLVDNAWFDKDFVFNTETGTAWISTKEKITFPTPSGKSWQDYVSDTRLEITCGEAPYLASRYDTVTGKYIPVEDRIGLLDRKLRVVSENTDSGEDWLKWAIVAYQSTYGFDWQGDNVLLARENLLFTFIDYYQTRFIAPVAVSLLREIAEILSWNIWQMDGLKFVIPDSCKEVEEAQLSLFSDQAERAPCPGCAKNDPYSHTGIYCKIKDWKANKTVKFVSLLKAGR